MLKKRSKEDRNMLALLKEAGAPTKNLIGRKFEFRFDDEAYAGVSFVGIVGSLQFWVWGGDEDKDINRLVITPIAPFPTREFDLVSGFFYRAEKKHWFADTHEGEWRKGQMIFY